MPAKIQPVSSIRNLGEAADRVYAAAGLTSADQVRELGADGAYIRLLQSGRRPHFIAYYCLVLGLQGRPWNDCAAEEKVVLRQRFDDICSNASGAGKQKGHSRLEAALAEIGVLSSQPTSSRPEKK